MLLAYLFYLYKFNMNAHSAGISLQYNRELFRIPIAMGGTVGLSIFTFALILLIPEYSSINFFITSSYSLCHPANCDIYLLNVY